MRLRGMRRCRLRLPHPAFPQDYISGGLVSFRNVRIWIQRYWWWLLRSRLSLVCHFPFFGFLRLLLSVLRWEKRAVANLERIAREWEEE